MANPHGNHPVPAGSGTAITAGQVEPMPVPGYGYPQQQAETVDIRRMFGILRRHAWLIAGCCVAAAVVGWLITMRAIPQYESAASLRIAEAEASVPGLEVLQQLGGRGSEVNTELEVLRSRTLIGEVVDRFGLRARIISPRGGRVSDYFTGLAVDSGVVGGRYRLRPAAGGGLVVTSPDSQSLQLAPGEDGTIAGLRVAVRPDLKEGAGDLTVEVVSREQAVSSLADAMRITRPSRDANILVVRYRGPDPSMVQAIPNGLVGAFVAQRVGTRKTGARSTVEFLRSQLDTLNRELREAEDTLRAFREQEQVVSIQQQAAVSVGKLAELQAARNQAAAELGAIEATMAGAVSRSPGEGGPSAARRLLAFPTLLRNPVISTLLENITALENQRSTLLSRRTERDPDVIALTSQIDALEGQIGALVATYTDGLRQQVAAYDVELRQSSGLLSEIPAKEVRLATLQRDATVLGELSTLLQTRLKEAEIAQAVEDPSAQVVDFAELPGAPVSPRPALNLALALLAGLMLGVGIAFGRELLDTRLHTADEVQNESGLPVIGIVPRFDAAITRGRPAPNRLRRGHLPAPNTALVAREAPHATVLEAYRALRTSLAFSAADGPPKLLLITSSVPGEGKSTTAANLAASLAQQHLKVVVVDADMRRGAIHRTLGGARGPGLSEVLVGASRFEEVIQQMSFDGVGQVDLIGTGTVPPNPAELLGSTRFHDLCEFLELRYDVVLIDSPPVNNVADALVIAPNVDGVILVTRGGVTEKGAVKFAMEQLRRVRANVIGAVLNDYDVKRAETYGGEYRYYHGAGYGPG